MPNKLFICGWIYKGVIQLANPFLYACKVFRAYKTAAGSSSRDPAGFSAVQIKSLY